MGLEEKIGIKRHEEVLGSLKGVISAISSQQKTDPEISKLLKENKEAINNFVKAVGEWKKQPAPEVNVETNQDKVVKAIGDLGEVLKGIGDRLTKLEEKEEEPKSKPTKLKAVRNSFSGEIDYVVIEYSK